MQISVLVAHAVLVQIVSAGLLPLRPLSLTPYAPYGVNCPSGPLTRNADSLSPGELDWVSNKQKITTQKLATFLKGANLTDINVDGFLANTTRPITIGQAFSGGGYRAMLVGAGEIAALDERTASSDSGLKGLLQASTYITGLSGGSWLVGTIAMNDFISVDEILGQSKIWDLTKSIFNHFGLDVLGSLAYFSQISTQIESKQLAGFKVTLTDPWARALSYQFLPNSDQDGAGLKWTDITTFDSYTKYEMPFPILVADGREPYTTIIDGNSTIFEFNPYEMGSWDPSLHKFANLQYLGTEISDGYPSSRVCINGFDNAGFLMGTSSSLFNQFILQINTLGLPSFLSNLISTFVLSPLSIVNVDIAYYSPNPFYTSSDNLWDRITKNRTLYLVDGGEDGQNVPLQPLMRPERKVDIIFAHDNSADIDGWPSGISLVSTFQRQFWEQGGGVHFPYVPDIETFRNANLTSKPTFFGCSAKNLSALTPDYLDIPLVVYIANRPFSYWSNTSTFKLSYTDDEKRGMIRNGYEIETRFNGTIDPEWPACVGCAIIRRQQERQGVEQTEQCKRCFDKYCWSGSSYQGADIGENFSNDGLTYGDEYYNAQNVQGIDDGGITLLKKRVLEFEKME
ncbi:lysophospholipase [Scheffersomyces xylosifermentans]|uniref:lysophospholipase n=1 Tax=Scheffersomyces xylosifermentans TaxID=1304137 RepID=UPI00315DF441